MQSRLNPNASDTTNSLLKILINKIDNSTFPAGEASLPTWNGPSSTTIWIQTLAYTSFSMSLLAAFGAVLGKQWLGHFKTSLFGRGSLHERCQRRQQKLNGLKAWHFSTIIATLPIFLQLSLFFFGIALAAQIWIQQHTVASVIMATTAFGFIFYFFTVVSSLRSPDCPFQTPVSTMLQLILQYTGVFRMVILYKWKRLLYVLRGSSRRALYAMKDLITKPIMPLVAYLSRTGTVRPLSNDPEVAGGVPPASKLGREQMESPKALDLGFRGSHTELAQAYAIQASAVQWILETSTDSDIVAAAARMVLEIEWPAKDDVTDVLQRLKSHFYACFDPTQQILPLAQARAAACIKAMSHFCVERDMGNPFHIYPEGAIVSSSDRYIYHMVPDHDFLVASCGVELPLKLDTTSLTLSDRMWIAHMFTYHLHEGHRHPEVVTFVIDFIDTCLDSTSPARLVADCMLLAGLLVGMRVDRRHLSRLDKR
jgi:Family of unknown function (DUF6535)